VLKIVSFEKGEGNYSCGTKSICAVLNLLKSYLNLLWLCKEHRGLTKLQCFIPGRNWTDKNNTARQGSATHPGWCATLYFNFSKREFICQQKLHRNWSCSEVLSCGSVILISKIVLILTGKMLPCLLVRQGFPASTQLPA